MPQETAASVTSPRSSSILASVSSPRLTCTDTASAPRRTAASTVQTRVLALGKGERLVLAERWMISPTSRPRARWPQRTTPLCMSTALAPPDTMPVTVSRMSSMPAMGPTETPWSSGTMMVRPVSRLTMRSRRMDLPMVMVVLLAGFAKEPGSRSALHEKGPPGESPAAPVGGVVVAALRGRATRRAASAKAVIIIRAGRKHARGGHAGVHGKFPSPRPAGRQGPGRYGAAQPPRRGAGPWPCASPWEPSARRAYFPAGRAPVAESLSSTCPHSRS